MVAHVKRGEAYLRRGETEAALRDLKTAVSLDPSAPRPHELLGDALLDAVGGLGIARLQLAERLAGVAGLAEGVGLLAIAERRREPIDELAVREPLHRWIRAFEWQVPVLGDLHAPVFEDEPVPRQQLMDAFEQRVRARRVAGGE